MRKVTVIGAGIIGLSVAYYLHKRGAEVTVIDRDPEGDKVSFGNAGSIAVMEVNPAAGPGVLLKVPGWLMDPLGPLSLKPAYAPRLIPWLLRFCRSGTRQESVRIHHALNALNQRVYRDLIPMFEDTGLIEHLHRTGALIVYESDAGYQRDQPLWKMRSESGVEVRYLTGDETRELEPALGKLAKYGVLSAQAAHVSDPKLITDSLREWLKVQGVNVITSEINKTLVSAQGGAKLVMKDGGSHYAENLVVAAGVWSAKIVQQLDEKVLLESERGYNTTLSEPGVTFSREVIFAERKFVMTPLSCGLRIGGAAEFGGINNPPNYKRSQSLLTLAKKYCPQLQDNGGIPWAGHRPSTPDSLPVISHSARHKNIYYAFGHGHLGLTQSATTGKLISDLVFGEDPGMDMTPYSVRRFQ